MFLLDSNIYIVGFNDRAALDGRDGAG